jgi:hypothetical protein
MPDIRNLVETLALLYGVDCLQLRGAGFPFKMTFGLLTRTHYRLQQNRLTDSETGDVLSPKITRMAILFRPPFC